MSTNILFISFFILLILGIPIGAAIGLSSILTLAVGGQIPLLVVVQRLFVSINSFPLMAIPFFMLAGTIMDRSGITQRLVNLASALVGWLKGGMCYVTVVTGMLMGGISGSAPADTAALTSIMVPSMKKLGYPGPFAAALQAASGSIGIIIPPSIPMIILGSIANISVGALFLGGFIPGFLIGISLMFVSAFISIKQGYGVKYYKKFTLKYLFISMKEAFLPMLIPIIIIGGILGGIFTPTEASVIAVIYTLFLGIFVYKSIKISDISDMFTESTLNAASVMFLIAASSLFSWILVSNGFSKQVSEFVFSVSKNPIFILLVINVIFFIGGMLLEGLALMIMLVPILLPIAMDVGIDPVAFGVMIVINIAIGTITPPVGVCISVASSSGGVNFESVAKSAVPFILSLVLVLLLVIIFPTIITSIPDFFIK